ncbi:MAG TPA: hypothetical protein VMF67_00900, partial [Rhizomicrobium sp.]|nr:hypothetical protein [Rhizomicrobium sp.]
QFVGKKATKANPAIAAPTVIASELMTAWGQTKFFMDASALPHTSATHHPLTDIAAACRSIGLRLVPATKLAAPSVYQNAVAAIVGTDHRGVGLRVDIAQMAKAAQWQPHFPFPPNQTDLIVDLADNLQATAALGAVVVQAFQQLHLGQNWRSVSIAGTSMPENFQGMPSGLHVLPRPEWVLWNSMHGHLPYTLGFGDYATVPVTPPPSGIAWGFPINVRYTLPGGFLICRGVGTTGYGGVDMGPQLTGHAKSIRQNAARTPLAHCWADQTIDAIAAGGGPQGLEHWVQLGVNRHIELTRHLLP